MNFTDKKIGPRSRDRRYYYAPTENGVTCPNLKVDVNGVPVRAEDALETYDVKRKHCICMESAPFCSYHLGDKTATDEYICHRYLVWFRDETKPVVDTHNKRLTVKDGELNWW
jgi:hypothetical protein